METGIYTFADIGTHPITGKETTAHTRIQQLMEEAELADRLGLDVFAVGEHHRPDYAVSAPGVILGAAAVRTRKIRLSSAVTVLSSEDPVRVFQQFATVDLLSSGRAEIMAGRGSFIESFPLFGYDLKDYDALFTEKLQLLMRLNEATVIDWKGAHTQTIEKRGVYPRPFQEKLPLWVAVGGTPESVVRAGQLGLPMALAIIGGQPARFAPYAKLYRDVYLQSGHDAAALQFSINAHCFIAEDGAAARETFFHPYAASMNRLGRERGWPPMSRAQFDASTEKEGALLVGSPDEVIEKIRYHHSIFGHTRFLAQMSIGTVPHEAVLRSIELFATKVAPQLANLTI